MINFLIGIVVAAASFFFMVFSLRYGVRGAQRMDQYFSYKRNSVYPGFQWYYRIPFGIGVIPEYFFAMVLTSDNYYRRNWWAIKTSAFISVLLFISLLKSRSEVYDYFSLNFILENGFLALFTSGSFVIFLNIIALAYTTLFVLICIESIKMHGIYAPVRILAYSLLCILMANLTMVTLSAIVFVAIAYLAIKIIWFLFFSSKKKKKEEEEESAGSILNGGFQVFKSDLYQWEQENKENPNTSAQEESMKAERKKPKITRRRKKKAQPIEGDIPRLHPD